MLVLFLGIFLGAACATIYFVGLLEKTRAQIEQKVQQCCDDVITISMEATDLYEIIVHECFNETPRKQNIISLMEFVSNKRTIAIVALLLALVITYRLLRM